MRFPVRFVRLITPNPTHSMRCLKWIAAVSSVLVAIAPVYYASAAEPDQKRLALQAISSLDQRVATLAHRLAIAGVGHCRASAPLPGLSVHHLSQYNSEFRDAARAQFKLDHRVRVLSVAVAGPADRAGVKPGDVIQQIDSTPLPERTVKTPGASAAFVEDIEEILEAESADGAVQLVVMRDAETAVLQIAPELGCRGKVNLKPSNDLNAYADGSNVIITTAIAGLAQDDAELAAVLAHELAHNFLGHRKFLDTDGRTRSLIRLTETEADKLSIHLLNAAGFDPHAALRFWKRYGPKQGGLFSNSGHPGWRSRIDVMAAEIETLGVNPESE